MLVPVPQILRVSRHTETTPVVGEVTGKTNTDRKSQTESHSNHYWITHWTLYSGLQTKPTPKHTKRSRVSQINSAHKREIRARGRWRWPQWVGSKVKGTWGVRIIFLRFCRAGMDVLRSRRGRKVKARKTTRQTLQNKIFQHAHIRITALTPKTSSMYNQSCFTSALMGACRGLCFPPVVSSQTTNYLTKNRKTAEKSARCRLNHLLRQMWIWINTVQKVLI